MPTIAERMFDGFFAESILETRLDDAGVEYERLGWDHYDCSVELHGVAPEFRLSAEAQKIIHEAGFHTAFVNHTDKWETHYSFKPKEEFKESSGWRVSYPHNRGEDEKGILVEKEVTNWPREWFETGYAVVTDPERS